MWLCCCLLQLHTRTTPGVCWLLTLLLPSLVAPRVSAPFLLSTCCLLVLLPQVLIAATVQARLAPVAAVYTIWHSEIRPILHTKKLTWSRRSRVSRDLGLEVHGRLQCEPRTYICMEQYPQAPVVCQVDVRPPCVW